MCSADIFLGLLAILFPPLPVWIKRGICSADSVINILLCLLAYIPGLIHAWYIIAKFPEQDYEYGRVPQQDSERGHRVTYVYVQPQGHPQPRANKAHAPAPGYGTNAPAGVLSQQPQHPQHQRQQEGVTQAGGSSSSDPHAVPPSYAEVVAGDNKIQTHD